MNVQDFQRGVQDQKKKSKDTEGKRKVKTLKERDVRLSSSLKTAVTPGDGKKTHQEKYFKTSILVIAMLF